jgi:hypothetical protein
VAESSVAREAFYKSTNKEITSMKRTAFLVAILFAGLFSATSLAQDKFKGGWMGEFENDRFRISLKGIPGTVDSNFDWSFGFDLEDVKELSAARANSAAAPVHFEIRRDAGTIVFDGTMKDGRGIGDYQFTANHDYLASLKAMGYDNLLPEQLLRLTIRDVNRGFIGEMRASGYDTATVDQLIRMRNHSITSGFITEMKALGLDKLSVEDLIRAHNHNINAAFIQEMKAAGLEDLSVDRLARLRNHKIDATYIRSLGEVGYKSLTADQLIRLRNHDVNAAFIKKVNDAGYKDLSAEDLIYIRSHGLDAYSTRRGRVR